MSQEKTEEPTAKKLYKAREKGEVAKSRELATAAVILGAAATFWATGPEIRQYIVSSFTLVFEAIEKNSLTQPVDFLDASLTLGLNAALPLLLVTMLAGGLAIFLQIGPLISFQKIKPDLKRIDPIKGTRNLFTRRQVVEFAKTLFKILVVGYVVWITLRDSVRGLTGLPTLQSAEATITAAGNLTLRLMLRVGGALAGLAVLDFFYQRWQHRQDQKMTKDEVKREQKESDGDPHIKQERARVHREILEHATLEDMRRADVLVVNPTHYAVALQYDDEFEQEAPQALAKGQDHLARRMIEVAQEEGIPIMRDVPLARSLFDLEVGTEIPEELFEAVAAILYATYKERQEYSQGNLLDD